jgi:hypothetical protein
LYPAYFLSSSVGFLVNLITILENFFSSKYLSSTGTVKYYNELPNLQMFFEDAMLFGDKKFLKCTIEKQVEKNATQSFAF